MILNTTSGRFLQPGDTGRNPGNKCRDRQKQTTDRYDATNVETGREGWRQI
jgi:hypothetical protein